MGVTNIIDNRKNKYRFKKINAIVEAAWHDNSVQNADIVPKGPHEALTPDGPSYEEREHISLGEAIKWGNEFSTPVTLYLYDENSGIYPVDKEFTRHTLGS